MQSDQSLLYSRRGYQYCDLLLDCAEWTVVHERAAKSLEVARRNRQLMDIAQDELSLGRAELGSALSGRSFTDRTGARREAGAARDYLDRAAAGLRAIDSNDDLPRPCSLVPRCAARSAIGAPPRATSTRLRISPGRGRCGFICAIRRWSGRGWRWQGRGVCAAQRACRRQPAEARAAGLGEARPAACRGRGSTPHRRRLHRELRVSPARRGTRRIAGGGAPRAQLRQPAAPRSDRETEETP